MKRFLFLIVLSLLSLSAFADKPIAIGAPAPSGFCQASECGSLPTDDPGSPTTSTPEMETCYAAKDYTTCIENCDCTYRNNKKKCGSRAYCLQVASLERSACKGNCLADW